VLSVKTRYAVRALACLARARAGECVLSSEIARSEHIPEKFLQRILRDLGQSAIVRSRKGRHGGFYLAKPAEDISVLVVIRACEQSAAPTLCLENPEWRCDGCERECLLRRALKRPYESYAKSLDVLTIRDVMEAEERR